MKICCGEYKKRYKTSGGGREGQDNVSQCVLQDLRGEGQKLIEIYRGGGGIKNFLVAPGFSGDIMLRPLYCPDICSIVVFHVCTAQNIGCGLNTCLRLAVDNVGHREVVGASCNRRLFLSLGFLSW